MKKILPDQLKKQTLLLGRWTIKQLYGKSVLYTTNLGSLIKFHLQASPVLRIEALDNGNPQMPPQYWAVRVNHGNWQRWSTRNAPFELALPDNAEVSLTLSFIHSFIVFHSPQPGHFTSHFGDS